MTETPEKAAELIWERAAPHFKKLYRTQYYIKVANVKFLDEYNFFFETVPMKSKTGIRRRSEPLHTLERYDLAYLERVVAELSKLTKLSIRYQGFVGMLWPTSGKVIATANVSDQEDKWLAEHNKD
ncbi:acetyl-CoA carboxylase [Pediococcus inopinatus]|uniref:acetyl-CoA carboxylase n=1 Tax=Pediococcus inopinatus TaxID=114090 RepID=UPI002B25F99B|nr:acetyl-CoA carboxylase [Pediococcus inopinatus]WPC19404.1 acetyl-CoA carboxylase [Pediococcus inopinatus]